MGKSSPIASGSTRRKTFSPSASLVSSSVFPMIRSPIRLANLDLRASMSYRASVFEALCNASDSDSSDSDEDDDSTAVAATTSRVSLFETLCHASDGDTHWKYVMCK